MLAQGRRTAWAIVVAAAMVGAGRARAQEGARADRGTVRGRVIRIGTSSAVARAQVFVAGTRLGAMTDDDGNYQIANVPTGGQHVRVRMLGYAPAEQEVQVTAGAVVTADFALHPAAIALDEIVVSGTAGQARRREVGNAVGQINAADISTAGLDVSRMLQGRVAGVSVSGTGGNTGAGSAIRLRGNSSVALSNQPLVYIDGVRVRSDEYPKNVPPTGFQGRSANYNASPLNDLNPDDIERVEVLKGAAATTLYGTEAAAGVIQIFTKHGSAGAPVWTAQVGQGFNQERPFGTAGADYLFMDPWLRRGPHGTYALSVAGGTTAGLRYYVSGDLDENSGVLPHDHERKTVVRGNFGFAPTEKLTFDWNTSFTHDGIDNTPAGNNAHGLTLNAFRRDRNYFGSANPDTISRVLDYSLRTNIDRLVLGGTATHQFNAHLQNKLTLGLDRADLENRNLRPYGFVAAPQGIISDQRWTSQLLTLDYVGSFDWTFGGGLHSNTAWGAQNATTDVTDVTGYAEGFPGPGVPTVSSGGTRLAYENRQRVISAGAFMQELLGLHDRYFLTLGLRVDGYSAFGADLGLQAYPKVSASYVLSEEPFWPERLGMLKLRAAYGQAGRAPGAFDAVQTWEAVSWGGQSALRPYNVGNRDLGPERTTELELGFDAAFLDSRLNADFTYYNDRTRDALLPVSQIPSMGFTRSQLENVGVLAKSGIELGLNGTLVRRTAFTWDAGLTVATNHSRVISLGGAAPFMLANYGWIMEGQPVAVMRGRHLANPDAKAAPDIQPNYLFGPSQPTRIIGVNTSFRMWRGIELSARGEYQGGHYIDEDASYEALSRSVQWPTCFDAYPRLAAGDTASLTAWQRAYCIPRNVHDDMFILPADFFKLRDVSLRVPMSGLVPRTSSAQLVLSAGNWYMWKRKEFKVFDPEQAGNDGFNAPVRYISEQIPAPATFMAQLRVTF